mmetsp:Transcript_36456/g.72609  ORF Transcript_36456/g.72609 Transcript_36456/m.72609 type:complete len:203 (-) Transcript_36456:167-775(-)
MPGMTPPPGVLFARYLQPLVRMSVKGWIWYQGEHNLASNGVSGNVLGGYGYACELVALIQKWRSLWAAVPNTTAADAPFGVVTLANNAHWHGGRDSGGFRHAQTAGFGVLPNELLPTAFLAQAYDVHDPWADERCKSYGCCESMPGRLCGNKTKDLGGPKICQAACAAQEGTPRSPLTSWLHPPLKRFSSYTGVQGVFKGYS